MERATVAVNGRALSFGVSSPLAASRVATFWTKEPSTLAWIDGFEPGAVFWDVGANIGLYSLYAAAKGHRAVAFEPLPANYAELCANIAASGLEDVVLPVPMPLCARWGAVERFSVADPAPGASGSQYGQKRGLQMVGATIDGSIFAYGLPHPDYIKIDVDGNERDILFGAIETLAGVKGLSVETDARAPGPSFEIVRFVESRGFEKVGSFPSPLAKHKHVANVHFMRRPAARQAA